MRINKIKFIFLFSLFLIFSYTFCYEDKESLLKRFNISKQISIYSNNRIKLIGSQNEGISCFADDFIHEKQILINVPKNKTLCPYYLFPFKYEILDFLFELPGLKQTVKSTQQVSFFLLSYYLLYYMYAPKQEIKNYIKEKKLSQYYNCDEIDDILKDYFPKEIPGSALLSKEHFDLWRSLGYPVPHDDLLERVFTTIGNKISNSEHKDMIIPWTSNFKQFKWAYTMISSRGLTLKLEDHLILEGIDLTKNTNQSIKKNYEVNKIFTSYTGAPCLLQFVDLINHYQPKNTDLRDKRKIFITTEKGNYLFHASHSYTPGEEILISYKNDPANIILFANFGFVLPYNIFNTYKITVKDIPVLTNSKFLLCRELKCVDPRAQDPRQIPSAINYDVRIFQIEESLINFGRVVYLDNDFDKNSILKIFANKGKFSNENELKAWMYYFKSFYNHDAKISELLATSIKEGQKSRFRLRNILNYWIDDVTKTSEYNRIKINENLYMLNVSYKQIVIRHLLASINQILLNINNDLTDLKIKYIA